ncbi:MAG: nuclear transport factor 2 family protein [Parasporobacterium sp.]|nr:nuclear transport factor 2 family protein [Parasporobacterium sp.]
MKLKKIVTLSVTAAMLVSCFTLTSFAAEAEGDVSFNGKTYTIEEAVERALAWQECSNLAGKHEDYHTALNHLGELNDLWVNEEPYTETMSWTNNTQKMVGYDNIYAFYVTDLTGHIESCLSSAINLDETGTIENTEEWMGTGMLWYHMLMSPIIEVAQDGQTAIAHWQSFGTVTEPSGGGSWGAQWTCEDYNMVFVKQSDGPWKIWHLRTFVHFYTNVDNHWYEQNMATQGAAGADVPTGVGVMIDEAGSEGTDMPQGESPEGESPEGEMPAGGPEMNNDYAIMDEYYQGFDLYCVPVQTGNIFPYETWADIEDTFLW